MAQRAEEARKRAEERARMIVERRSQFDQSAANRRQQQLSQLRQQQLDLSTAQSRMLQAGFDRSRRGISQRTAPVSNFATGAGAGGEGRSPVAPVGGAVPGGAAGQGGIADAINAFDKQTAQPAARAGKGGGGAGAGGDGVGIGDPALQGLLDTLTGAGFSESTASQILSLATSGSGGGGSFGVGGGGAAASVATTLFANSAAITGAGGVATGGQASSASTSSADNPSSGVATSGVSKTTSSGTTAGTPAGSTSTPPTDQTTTGPPATDVPPPLPDPPPSPTVAPASASLVGVTISSGAIVGGVSATATVRILQPVEASTTINVSVDDDSFVSVPSAIAIPGAAVSTTFTISTIDPDQERLVLLTVSLGDESRTVQLRVQPASEPAPPPPPEPKGPVIARWLRVPNNDCADVAPFPSLSLPDFFTNDLYLGFTDPPTVDGAGSPIPLILDSKPDTGLRIEGGEFFQHPFAGNGPTSSPTTPAGQPPSCVGFDSFFTIGGAAPAFLPGRQPPSLDWPDPVDSAWFTLAFGDVVVEQDAARFGDNRFYVRIARLTAPKGVRVKGAIETLFPGVIDAGGVVVDIPDRPEIWGQFDLNADGLVTAADARALSGQMGSAVPNASADLNGDGAVSGTDMRLMIDAIRKN